MVQVASLSSGILATVIALCLLSACQHAAPLMDADALDRAFPEPHMSDESHTLLRPYGELSYIAESELRRGLPAHEVVIDDRILDRLSLFLEPYQAGFGRWREDEEQAHWYMITHIGLSPEGDIRMIDINHGGRFIPRGETAPTYYEVYVIRPDHPRYAVALSRVMTLLQRLQRGSGMVRLTPELDTPWPFFDYDFVAAPLVGADDHRSESGALPARIDDIPRDLAISGDTWPAALGLDGYSTFVDAVSWQANGDLLLCVGEHSHNSGPLIVQRLRLRRSHPQYGAVIAELQRVVPGFRRGVGFVSIMQFRDGPWPFVPYEQGVDNEIARLVARGQWYDNYLNIPPPPPMAPPPR